MQSEKSLSEADFHHNDLMLKRGWKQWWWWLCITFVYVYVFGFFPISGPVKESTRSASMTLEWNWSQRMVGSTNLVVLLISLMFVWWITIASRLVGRFLPLSESSHFLGHHSLEFLPEPWEKTINIWCLAKSSKLDLAEFCVDIGSRDVDESLRKQNNVRRMNKFISL